MCEITMRTLQAVYLYKPYTCTGCISILPKIEISSTSDTILARMTTSHDFGDPRDALFHDLTLTSYHPWVRRLKGGRGV